MFLVWRAAALTFLLLVELAPALHTGRMQILEHEPLSAHTTFKFGGPARFFADATSVDELCEARRFAEQQDMPLMILGGGSNVVASDAGFDGLVIRPRMRGILYEGDLVRVGAGEDWDALVADTVAHGLWGLENLSGIPGSVGATPIQNVGAYGVEVAEKIASLEALHLPTCKVRSFAPHECRFAYRDSFFKSEEGREYVVLSVTFGLSRTPTRTLSYKDLARAFEKNPEPTLLAVRETVLGIRAQKFPDLAQVGTAGSFFKNPIIDAVHYEQLSRVWPELPGFPQGDGRVKVPLAFLLERLGWKGVREGAVGVWHAQPLVLVHYGGGSADELEVLAEKIERDVNEKTEIVLEREVRSM